MSDKNKNDRLFRNEDTLVRRAWIESAIEGVRASLGSGFNALEFGEPINPPAALNNEPQATSKSRFPAAGKNRPSLYVAWSASARRSGT